MCVPPLCYGTSSASANASKTKVEGEFASVAEQSGIKAGDGGFQVEVRGHTELKGAAIASTQAAIDAGRNVLQTATLATGDLQNKDEYSATSISVGVGYGSDPSANKSGINGASAGVGYESGRQTSTTRSGISGGSIVITDEEKQRALTGQRRRGHRGGAQPRGDERARTATRRCAKQWDGEQLKQQVQAEAEITAVFGQRAAKAVGDYAEAQEKALIEQAAQEPDATRQAALLAEAEKWDEGGIYRVAAHTVVGALAGGAPGALGAGTSAAVVPKELGDAIDAARPARAAAPGADRGGGHARRRGHGRRHGSGRCASTRPINNYLNHEQIEAPQGGSGRLQGRPAMHPRDDQYWERIERQQSEAVNTTAARAAVARSTRTGRTRRGNGSFT